MRLDSAIKLSARRWAEAGRVYWKVRRKDGTAIWHIGASWQPGARSPGSDWIAIVPKRKRDVGVDPKVGDVLIRGKERFTVIYIGEEYVLSKQCNVAIGEYPLVIRRADWCECLRDWNCVIERVEEKANG